MDIDAQVALIATPGEWRAAARSGEWAQHFSNASCVVNSGITEPILTKFLYNVVELLPINLLKSEL